PPVPAPRYRRAGGPDAAPTRPRPRLRGRSGRGGTPHLPHGGAWGEDRTGGGRVSESTAGAAEHEVLDICRDLIRMDTSNYGDGSGPGERVAAEYVAEQLAEVGLEPRIFESRPGRASTVARIEGTDPSRPALLIHGHTDVVP